ncbi:MAG: cation transporter [Verrucomicrobiales bacterium]|nr:cation transporter [Verrucomicrobiales bacterium]
MKSTTILILGAALAAFTSSVRADATITLSGVHNCCKSCTKGIEGAITKAGATAVVDDTTVTITAKSEGEAKKAAEALVAAGYFGEGATAPAITDAKVKTATVGGVHLCCGKCVTAVEKAIKTVPGATTHTATKGAEKFTVEGDFSTKELAAALNKAGFSGSIQ